jgi:hypothetical protein
MTEAEKTGRMVGSAMTAAMIAAGNSAKSVEKPGRVGR